MHGPDLHADRFGRLHADQQVFEHCAVGRCSTQALGGEQVDVGLVLADVVRVIDGDDIVEQIEHADVA